MTDAAAYNIKAAKDFKEELPNTKFLTWIAHMFHNISEHVMMKASDILKFIHNMNDLIYSNETFRDLLQDITLPTKFIKTRWSFFINTCT